MRYCAGENFTCKKGNNPVKNTCRLIVHVLGTLPTPLLAFKQGNSVHVRHPHVKQGQLLSKKQYNCAVIVYAFDILPCFGN